MSEADYERGSRAVWQRILGQAPSARWRALCLNARPLSLRSVCEDHGDNDWESDLHLADVVEKHLARHLDAGAESDEEE